MLILTKMLPFLNILLLWSILKFYVLIHADLKGVTWIWQITELSPKFCLNCRRDVAESFYFLNVQQMWISVIVTLETAYSELWIGKLYLELHKVVEESIPSLKVVITTQQQKWWCEVCRRMKYILYRTFCATKFKERHKGVWAHVRASTFTISKPS